MTKLHHAAWLALAYGLTGSLTGCPLAIVGGLAAAGGAGYAANQERGVNGSVNDFTIKNKIQNAWLKSEPTLPVSANVTVYEGRVLLTGTTDTPQRKAAAAEIAQGIPGVRAVYNDIEVGPGETMKTSASDTWITSEVKSKLVFSNVRSVNYDIKTVKGAVYLIGSARSQAELDHATDLARNVPGVQRVVSYVEVRSGAPPGAQPPIASSAPSGAGPDAVAPAPTTPVQVQKL